MDKGLEDFLLDLLYARFEHIDFQIDGDFIIAVKNDVTRRIRIGEQAMEHLLALEGESEE